MLIYLYQTAWSLATTTDYERQFTGNRHLQDQSSYNPTYHKATTIRILTRPAQLVCDSLDSLQDETDYLNTVFSRNNYNADSVRSNTHSKANAKTQTNVNSGHVTTATITYIRCTTETITRILEPCNLLYTLYILRNTHQKAVVNFHTQMSSSQSKERTMLFRT